MSTVDDFIAALPELAREATERARATIHQAVPGLTEKIAYGVPTFVLEGKNLLHLGGYAKHVAVYPIPSDDSLRERLQPFIAGKGTLKFSLSSPIPYELIADVARAFAAARK